MSQQYTTMSLEAVKLLCSVINKTVDLPSTVISDTSIATNTTYSSHKLDKEFTTLEDELKHYTDTAIAGLNKLTKEIINDKALVVKDNVLYLYKAADDPSNDYMQMMLINGVAVELGSTQVYMSDYYNKTDSDNRFAAKLDLDTLTTSFNDLKDVIGDTSLLKNTTLVEDVQELYTGLNDRVKIADIATTLDNTVTDGQVASALLTKTELDKKADKSYVDDNFVSHTLMIEQIPDNTSFKSLIPTEPIAYKGYVGCFAEFRYAYVVYIRFFDGVRIEKHPMGDTKSAYCIYVPSQDTFTEWVES